MGNVNSEFSAKMGQSNCPTLTGVLVHTAAFSLVLSWVMTLKDYMLILQRDICHFGLKSIPIIWSGLGSFMIPKASFF